MMPAHLSERHSEKASDPGLHTAQVKGIISVFPKQSFDETGFYTLPHLSEEPICAALKPELFQCV
jgi:hypothetical protein